MVLAVLGSGSPAPSPKVGFGISHPQGLRACRNFKSIDQFSEGITHYCCHFLPKSCSKEGGKALLRVCVGQTLPASTGTRVPLRQFPDKSGM